MPLMVSTRANPRPAAKPADTTKAKAPKKPKPKSVDEVTDRLRRLGDYPLATGPYDTEDYDALTRRRLDWMTQRKRLLELQRQRSRATDTDALKARNQPTEEIAVNDPESMKRARKNLTRVRQSEAWRHKQLSAMQRQAEIEMELAWKSRTQGMGAAVSKYGAVGGSRDGFEISSAIDGAWRTWMDTAKARELHVAAFLDCLSEPKTLADIEKERKLKPGSVIATYKAGLDLWCGLRGWAQ